MRKVIFSDKTELNIDNLAHAVKNGREWKQIDLAYAYSTVSGKFKDGIGWSHSWDSLFVDEAGKETKQVYTEDLSEFSVRGDIVVHADGKVTVYMGKKTEVEKLQAELTTVKAELAAAKATTETKTL